MTVPQIMQSESSIFNQSQYDMVMEEVKQLRQDVQSLRALVLRQGKIIRKFDNMSPNLLQYQSESNFIPQFTLPSTSQRTQRI